MGVQMGLIACPECKHQVSAKAPSCVKCGAPIAAQTIEATGKKWKMMQLCGAALIALGFVGLCSASSGAASSADANPAWMLLAGLVLTVWGRVGAWWNHA